ncbi:MAG: pyruvate formate lyase family protein, partial [Bacteroidota bacterium]
MNERIKRLREISLSAIKTISHERAALVTEFYKKELNKEDSVPVQRAKAFRYILSNKKISIIEDELIVGERGPAPAAVPTYPEITLHSLKDLNILNDREKVSYKVPEETRSVYENEIIPFWKGASQRERIMGKMSTEWKDAYEAGVFTEFQEQRAPGHTVAGGNIYSTGLLEMLGLEDFDDSIVGSVIETHSVDELTKQNSDQLAAMKISAIAIVEFALRYSKELEKFIKEEKREWRKKELAEMARVCKKVPAYAPSTFHEALQYYWFMHVGVIIESNPWDSFNPGRLDQHLYPFYKKEIEEGTLTRERAKELLQSFWIKFHNHPAPPKVGVTAKESNTYTDFALINLGGLDVNGNDAVNELSYLILDVIEEMRILQPSSMIQVSSKNPDEYIRRALNIIKSGFGQPSVFNTDVIIEELLRQGKSLRDARNGGASGCV